MMELSPPRSLLALLLFCSATVTAAAAASSIIESHVLTDVDPMAVCIDGSPAVVFANASTPAAKDNWVIQIGAGNGGAGLFCWMDPSGKPTGQMWDCSWHAKPKNPTPKPPAAVQLGAAGPQDTNCTRNPDWCQANFAQITTCDFSMLLGDAVRTVNGTTMHFRGRAILTASLKKLGTLGLSSAKSVVLTGETHAGTAALLSADFIGGLLKAIAPGLSKFKVLPADGAHPRFSSMFNMTMPGMTQLWFDPALANMAALANVTGALSPECLATHPGNESYQCMYFSEAAPHVKTPLFAVQSMPGVSSERDSILNMHWPLFPALCLDYIVCCAQTADLQTHCYMATMYLLSTGGV